MRTTRTVVTARTFVTAELAPSLAATKEPIRFPSAMLSSFDRAIHETLGDFRSQLKVLSLFAMRRRCLRVIIIIIIISIVRHARVHPLAGKILVVL